LLNLAVRKNNLTHKKWLKNQREQLPKLPISGDVLRKSQCHRWVHSLICFNLLEKGMYKNTGGETKGAKGLMGSPSSGCVPGNVELNASKNGLLTD